MVMDDLKKYIFDYYPGLMTPKEAATYKAMHAEMKAQSCENPKQAEMLRRHWGSSDPEVVALASKGMDKFIDDVVERMLREQSGQIYFNRCPKCQALARTPTAKQCPKCFYSWHENSPGSD